jgi:hypothetical protein
MSKTIDLAGLPPQAVKVVESLVDLLQQKQGTLPQGPLTLSDEEFESILDELARGETRPVLPANFGRREIYGDHD